MKYTQTYRTRWHDTDAWRSVRLSQLLVYMQETSNGHLESLGMSLDTLRDERKLAFILSKLRLSVSRPLHACENITVETWTQPSVGFSSRRSFRILAGEEVVAEADTTWALLGTEDRRLHKADEAPYVFEDEAPVEPNLPMRIRFPADLPLEKLGERRIVYSDLDYNMHMNNTRYPDMLCDFLPSDEIPHVGGMVLSYLHEASFGDTLSVFGAKDGNSRYLRTVNESGKVCLEAQILFS